MSDLDTLGSYTMRYELTVADYGTVTIVIGHDFTAADVAELVAVENAARAAHRAGATRPARPSRAASAAASGR